MSHEPCKLCTQATNVLMTWSFNIFPQRVTPGYNMYAGHDKNLCSMVLFKGNIWRGNASKCQLYYPSMDMLEHHHVSSKAYMCAIACTVDVVSDKYYIIFSTRSGLYVNLTPVQLAAVRHRAPWHCSVSQGVDIEVSVSISSNVSMYRGCIEHALHFLLVPPLCFTVWCWLIDIGRERPRSPPQGHCISK